MRNRLIHWLMASIVAACVASSPAVGQCGEPGSGSCGVPNGTPGCEDAECCQAVCNLDPFCCDSEWDSICVDEAAELCGNCAPACNKENIECLNGSPQYDNRGPVGQLVAGGDAFCTAWIVAAPNIIMTNEHCVEGNINGVSVRFNAECDACDGGTPKLTESYPVLQIIHESPSLDYALLRVAGDPAATWGVAAVDEMRPPVIGGAIYEIHHGDGKVKGYDAGVITDLDVPGSCIPGTQAEIRVTAIATGGASGAPIFSAESHCVVGICHCGPPCSPGWGVPMSFIMPDALPRILDAGGEPAACGDGPPCPADLDEDGEVTITDFLALLSAWGTDPGGPPDLDGDGTVGITDFLALLSAWGECP